MAVEPRQIPIQSPCPVTLDRTALEAAERAVHCGHCRKDVHLLSHLTEREARVLLACRSGEDICVSYAIRSDGTIRFRPDPRETLVPTTALVRRMDGSPLHRLARVASFGASTMLAACAAHGDPEPIGPLASDDPFATIDMPMIPDEPCDRADDQLVDGGIQAAPVPELDSPRRGGVRARPIPPVENVVAGGIQAAPIGGPQPRDASE